MKSLNIAVGLVLFAGLVVGSYRLVGAQRASAQTEETGASPSGFAAVVPDNSERMLKEGQHTFRFDTFGDEAWWGDTLHLHEAIEGAKLGGIGPGISPATALSLGLKVDLDALPASLVQQLKLGKVNLNDPAVTLALLKLNAVVGVTGHSNPDGSLKSVGIQCALCHSTVDNALAARNRSPAGRLGQPRSECWRDHCRRSQSAADCRSAQHGSDNRSEGAK